MLSSGFSVSAVAFVGKISLVIAALMSLSATDRSGAQATLEGTVAMVSGSQLTLATADSRMTFHVPADTLIYVNRAEASLEEIEPGYFAIVTASRGDGPPVAALIDARRQY